MLPFLDAPVVVYDSETELISSGYILPRPAIATTYLDPQDATGPLAWLSGAKLWLTRELDELWERLLTLACAGLVYIAGHDVARFDCNVTGAHYPHHRRALQGALAAGRVLDTIQAERIIEIHRGTRAGAGLDDLCRKYGVPFGDKSDPVTKAIRMSFGQYIGAEQIPAAHAEYALNDAIAPHTILERQLSTQLVDHRDLAEFCRRAYNGGRVAARGFRTSPDRVDTLERLVGARITELEVIAREYGFLRGNRDGTVSKNKKAIQEAVACDYAGVEREPIVSKSKADLTRQLKARVTKLMAHPAVPRTKASSKFPEGQIKTDRLTLEDAEDPKLQALAEWDQMLYIRNKDLKIFRDGAVSAVQPRFTIVNTGRFATSNPQAHNFGKASGVRECITARDGYGLVVSDFRMLELVALAELCVRRLGLHTMAQKIRDGVDMHAEIGADVLGCAYDEIMRRRAAGDHAADEARDSGKPANFGLNGGMTDPKTFQLYARKSYGQLLTLEQCEAIIAAWKRRAVDQQAWLEAVRSTGYYMRRVNPTTGEVEQWRKYDMLLPGFYNVWRRGLSRTEASNNPFQAFGANISHLALQYVLDAQYCPAVDADGAVGPGALWGSHVVLTTHDDIVSETPLGLLAAHAEIQQTLMARAARELAPGVFHADTPLKRIVDTRVLSHLSKGAAATRAADGTFQITQVQMPQSLKGKT